MYDFFGDDGAPPPDHEWTDALRTAIGSNDAPAIARLAALATEVKGRIARLVRELYAGSSPADPTLRAAAFDALFRAAASADALIAAVDADDRAFRALDDEDDAAAGYVRSGRLASRHRVWEWLEEEFARAADRTAWLPIASRRVDSLVWSHDFDAAIALAERVVRVTKDALGPHAFEHATAIVRLAAIRMSSGDAAGAVAILERDVLSPAHDRAIAEAWSPELRVAFLQLGIGHFTLGHYRAAFDAWERLADLEDRPRTRRIKMPPTVMTSTGGDNDALEAIADDIRACLVLGGISSEAAISNFSRTAAELSRRGRRDDEAVVRDHVDRIVDATAAEKTEFARETLVRAGEYLQNNREYAESARVLERLLAHWPEGDDPVYRAVAIQHRGLALLSAGDAPGAVALLAPLVSALDGGDDGPDACLLRGNFAAALLRAGRPAEALPIYRALADRARADGHDDDRDLMDVCAAETLFVLGRRDEARELFARAVDACEARGALVSPTGIRAIDGLVGALLDVGSDDAITAQQRMLDATRNAYGDEHPATWLEEANVAIILAQRGRREEARQRFDAVLERQQASFGENSADAIRTRKNLARLLREMGRSDEAMRLEAKLPDLESRAVEWTVFRPPQL